MVVDCVNGAVQVILPIPGDQLRVNQIMFLVKVWGAHSFESAQQKVVSALDKAIYPWCISWCYNMLNLVVGAEVIHHVILEV